MVPPHTFTEEEFSSARRVAFRPGNKVAANGASPSLLNRCRPWTKDKGVRYRVYNIGNGVCEAFAKLQSKWRWATSGVRSGKEGCCVVSGFIVGSLMCVLACVCVCACVWLV